MTPTRCGGCSATCHRTSASTVGLNFHSSGAWNLSTFAGAFAPRDVAARFAALGWIWPVPCWSALGARDREHGTSALLDASLRPVARQLPAAWSAGWVLALGSGSGFGLAAARPLKRPVPPGR